MSQDYYHFTRLAAGRFKSLLFAPYTELDLATLTLQRVLGAEHTVRHLESKCREVAKALKATYRHFQQQVQDLFAQLMLHPFAQGERRLVPVWEDFFAQHLGISLQWSTKESSVDEKWRKFFFFCITESNKEWELTCRYVDGYPQGHLVLQYGFLSPVQMVYMGQIWEEWLGHTIRQLTDCILLQPHNNAPHETTALLEQLQAESLLTVRKQINRQIRQHYARKVRHRGRIARQLKAMRFTQVVDTESASITRQAYLESKVPECLPYDSAEYWEYFYLFLAPKPTPEQIEAAAKFRENVGLPPFEPIQLPLWVKTDEDRLYYLHLKGEQQQVEELSKKFEEEYEEQLRREYTAEVWARISAEIAQEEALKRAEQEAKDKAEWEDQEKAAKEEQEKAERDKQEQRKRRLARKMREAEQELQRIKDEAEREKEQREKEQAEQQMWEKTAAELRTIAQQEQQEKWEQEQKKAQEEAAKKAEKKAEKRERQKERKRENKREDNIEEEKKGESAPQDHSGQQEQEPEAAQHGETENKAEPQVPSQAQNQAPNKIEVVKQKREPRPSAGAQLFGRAMSSVRAGHSSRKREEDRKRGK